MVLGQVLERGVLDFEDRKGAILVDLDFLLFGFLRG